MEVFINVLSEFSSLHPLEHFGVQPFTRHRSIVNDVLSECQASALQKIKWLLEMEKTAPFTLNEHYYKDYRETFLNSYRNAQGPYECEPGYEGPVISEPYNQALHYMASARAYFQGSHRFRP